MMPDMDGFEVCRRLKTNPATHHIPVVMVTALDQPSDRVRGLEAGADDFLTKPISDVALIARVRSLARLKMMTDELRMRAVTSREIGIEIPEREAVADTGRSGRVLIVDDRPASHERIAAMLAERARASTSRPIRARRCSAPPTATTTCSSCRSGSRISTRCGCAARSARSSAPATCRSSRSPRPTDNARMVRGLEIGVNDYLMRPIDKNELLARARTQMRKHRYTERLRDNVQMSIEMAITDALTGLYNRRYMESHLGDAGRAGSARGKPLTVLVLDIDYFKSINDTHGHDAGDDVLREFALRIKQLDPRHRSRLPLRRRGVRRGHAGDRHGGRHHGGRAAAPAHRGRAVRDPAGRAQHSR